MRTTALTVVAALAALTLSARADDKDAATAFRELRAEMSKKVQAAPKDERRKLAYAYADKFAAHAAKHPGDPSAVEAVVMVLQIVPPGRSEARAEALKLLSGEVGKQVAVKRHLKSIAGNPLDDDALKVVVELAKSHPDKTTRAWATYALSKGYETRGQLAVDLEKDAKARERYEKDLGKEVVRELVRGGTNARFRARQYRTKLGKDYPGVFPDLSVGKPIPELEAEDLDGKKVKLSDLKGKVVVLDFWATWCGHCIKMIPHERELVARLKDRPFVLLSISGDDSKATVKRFLEKTPMPWTHWYVGERHEVIDTWEIEGYPTILVVDHKGIIRYKDVREKRMDEAVENLLKEMAEEK